MRDHLMTVPPSLDRRAHLLATEHWSLLATRSQMWNEVMSRIMAQFTFTSAVIVVLALVVQREGLDGPFRPLALGLGAAVFLTGTLTAMRVLFASHEDLLLVRGMNRLRHGYVEMDPGIAQYLVTGHTDDGPGLVCTYTLGPRRAATQVMAGASVFITTVTALVAGGLMGLLVSPLGAPTAVVFGVLAGLAYLGVFTLAGLRQWAAHERMPQAVHFPSVSGG